MKPKYLHLLDSGAAFTALATVLPLGLSSCSNDDLDSPGGRSASMTLTVAKGDIDNTRTQLREENGSLVASWTAGENPDRLLVADASGRRLGYLTLTSIDPQDASVATFNGNLDGLSDDDTQQLRLFYLGTKADATTATAPLTLGYADQRGTMESLTDADLLTGEVTATLQGSVIAANDRAVLERKVAHAHFKLDLPVAATEPMTVTITGDNVKNSIVMESFNGDFRTTDGPITVTATAAGDFYMTVVPAEAVTLTFTTSVGGKSYRGTLPSRNWTNQEYVRAGEDDGVAITMTEYSDPYAEYADEDPRNPLHKFAKYNLTREGDQTNWSNVFASSETENGALYQWGRNYGYIDNQGIYKNSTLPDGSSWGLGTDFINFVDAMGTIDYEEAENKYGIFDYYVYNSTFSAYYGDAAITTGTGMHTSSGLRFYDMPRIYTDVETLKANPTKYFMDGRNTGEKLRGYGSYAAGMDEMNNNPDYWVTTFGDGGTTWTQRATACGYDSGNPCPEYWRMPTAEEMREIAPEGAGLDSQKGYLSSMLSNYSELRQTKDGVRYAIRWIYNRNAITIEAVVVDDSYTSSSQITSLFWDQHASDKVVRQFPFTGVIRPFIGNSSGAMLDTTWICRPLHNGLADIGFFPLGYYDYYTLMGPADGNSFNEGFGCYWVEDKGVAFKFATRDIASSLSYSCLLVESAEPVYAYAIRPVMDL